MEVLISGGAGYIGSTVASACLEAGISPVILDNLVTGRREFATGRAFYQGDIADGAVVDRIFVEHPEIYAVIHCAALIVVPQSMADPIGYYRANVAKSLEFAMRELLAAFNKVVDRPVQAIETGRRPGDISGAYTRTARAESLLGWRAIRHH